MKIEFPASLRRRMRRRLWWAGRREIGGILMAEQIAPGHLGLPISQSMIKQEGRRTLCAVQNITKLLYAHSLLGPATIIDATIIWENGIHIRGFPSYPALMIAARCESWSRVNEV